MSDAPAVVAVLGGSSAFAPLFAAALAARRAELPPLAVRLIGRDAARTRAVAAACDAVARRRGAAHRYVARVDAAEGCAGARIVVNQARIGGFAGRAFDETWPLRFGAPGDEGLLLGGLSAAIRAYAPTAALAAAAARTAAPGAFWLGMASPLGALVAAAEPVFGARAFGLCELPAATRRAAGLSEDAPYLGVNHFGWFFRRGEGVAQATPLKYVRLLDAADEVVREQRARPSRGAELDALSARLHASYARDPEREPPELAERAMPWLTEAAAPAVVALLGGTPCEAYVTARAGVGHPHVAADAYVERRALLGPEGLRTFDETADAPAALAARWRGLVAYDAAVLRAARDPSPGAIAAAVAALPTPLPADVAAEAAAFLAARVAAGATLGPVD